MLLEGELVRPSVISFFLDYGKMVEIDGKGQFTCTLSLHFFLDQSQINTCQILLFQPALVPLACTSSFWPLPVNFGSYSLHFSWFWFKQPALFHFGSYSLHFSWFWFILPALFHFGSYSLHFSWFWFNQPAPFNFVPIAYTFHVFGSKCLHSVSQKPLLVEQNGLKKSQ